MLKRVSLFILFSLVNLAPLHAQDAAGVFDKALAGMASNIAKALSDKYGAATPRLLVLPFGDDEGKISTKLGNNAKMVQYQLVQALEPQSSGHFLIIPPASLRELFKQKGKDPTVFVEPSSIAPNLKLLGVQAVLIGRVLLNETKDGVTPLSATLYFDQGDPIVISAQAPTPIVKRNGGEGTNPKNTTEALSGRFNVEILTEDLKPFTLRDGSPAKLGRCCADGSSFNDDFHNVLFLTLPESARGLSYVIRVSNNGKNPVARVPANDPNRLFMASVYVDGVSTFLGAKGEAISPDPLRNKKWVLTAPGQIAVAMKDAVGAFSVVPSTTDALGHSVSLIKGFQKNEEWAEKFVLASSAESLAYELDAGATNLGLISVYFYAQRLPSDLQDAKAPVASGPAATKRGEKIANRIFNISTDTYKDVVEAWKIHYRFEEDLAPKTPIPTTHDLVISELNREIGLPNTGSKKK